MSAASVRPHPRGIGLRGIGLRGFGRRGLALVRRHWLLSLVVVAGLVLRLLTWLAYRPALLYVDSFHYLGNVAHLNPSGLHPLGYAWVLKALLPLGGLTFVVAVQHLLGVALAIALYALARRLRVPRWLSAVVAAVPLLDAYQLQVEQNILSEIWLQTILVGLMWVLLGPRRQRWFWAALAGLLVGAALITRTIGGVVALPVLVFLITCGGSLRLRSGGWAAIRQAVVRVVAAGVVLAVVLVAYAANYRAVTGVWGLSGIGSHVLYGRAATLADCEKLPLDETMAKLCPPEPVEDRRGVNYYTHDVFGERNWPGGKLPEGTKAGPLASEFGRLVLRHQPLDFVAAALKDFAKNFALVKKTAPKDVPIERWQFQTDYPRFPDREQQADEFARTFGGSLPSVNKDLAAFLRGYQLSIGYTPGPGLALAALAGVGATFSLGRSRRSGLRSAAMVSAGSALILLVGASAFEFSWRYELPALVLLPLGGAIGLTALFGGRRSGRRLDPFPDAVDAAAVETFEEEYGAGGPSTGSGNGSTGSGSGLPGSGNGSKDSESVVVLIAAYNEAEGIGAVLRNIPDQCAGLPVSVLVVVDGAADRTAEIAAEHGAYVCDVPQNRGQGAALRLGYHLARQLGATYVVTTDADGQYDNSELPTLLQPLLDDEADFVSGSRRLGSEEADSRMRWLGVRVFAWLASLLTRQRITDTSFGFRAMRPERACSVRLTEPQYQASELLLGMLAGGARLRELPLSMRFRNNGTSKKGRTLTYGANYARVMLSTWRRDYVHPSTRQKRIGRRGRTSR